MRTRIIRDRPKSNEELSIGYQAVAANCFRESHDEALSREDRIKEQELGALMAAEARVRLDMVLGHEPMYEGIQQWIDQVWNAQ